MIEIDGLGKKYLIRHAERYLTLRDKIADLCRAPFNNAKRKEASHLMKQDFWALSDISFDVKLGETVGIIGRNGAGKTTLLKILSRITYPTKGRVKLYGRVASLLEVGTGFHPELSGRENIFFNGSILGMRKREIREKFDAIVDFADVERFIDTPVKRYSSGMQLRLAFAVAAHLEPEILIVDEVLAVGDAVFQKKCLGKMSEVVRDGRTVFFVSHNMAAVQKLCSRCILLDSGRVKMDGDVNAVINAYLNMGVQRSGERIWDIKDAPGDDVVRLAHVKMLDRTNNVRDEFAIREPIAVEIEYAVLKPNYPINTMCYFVDEAGSTKFVSIDNLDSPWSDISRPVGTYRCTCHVPEDLLNEGTVKIHVVVTTSPSNPHVIVHDVLVFKVIDDMNCSGVRGNYPREWPQAVVRPRLKWDVLSVNNRSMIHDG
jgi:ABC-type polysaccharide/polyol phosphate transport system, ATPase component